VIFILECSRTEIDKPDFCVKKYTSLGSLTGNCRRRRRDLAVVGEGLIVIVAEENILWLQIRVDEVQIVEDCH
jgi:hypothetical protein